MNSCKTETNCSGLLWSSGIIWGFWVPWTLLKMGELEKQNSFWKSSITGILQSTGYIRIHLSVSIQPGAMGWETGTGWRQGSSGGPPQQSQFLLRPHGEINCPSLYQSDPLLLASCFKGGWLGRSEHVNKACDYHRHFSLGPRIPWSQNEMQDY